MDLAISAVAIEFAAGSPDRNALLVLSVAIPLWFLVDRIRRIVRRPSNVARSRP